MRWKILITLAVAAVVWMVFELEIPPSSPEQAISRLTKH